jgi:hypothetical protein
MSSRVGHHAVWKILTILIEANQPPMIPTNHTLLIEAAQATNNPDQPHLQGASVSISPDSNDQSFESFHNSSSSPIMGLDGSNVSDVFVTPPTSPRAASPGPATAGMGTAETGLSPGPGIRTPPCTTVMTMRPRLSDVFAAQVPDLPAPGVVTGLAPKPLVTLVPVPARPPVTLGVDFIQINCGKRISAMTLLETNTKNKIALIQEPYTSINGCTLLHNVDRAIN